MLLAIVGQRMAKRCPKNAKKSQNNAQIMLASQNNATLVPGNALFYFK